MFRIIIMLKWPRIVSSARIWDFSLRTFLLLQGKVLPVRCHATQKGCPEIVLLCPFGTRWGRCSTPRLGRFTLGKSSGTYHRRLDEPQDPSGRILEEKIPFSTGARTPEGFRFRVTGNILCWNLTEVDIWCCKFYKLQRVRTFGSPDNLEQRVEDIQYVPQFSVWPYGREIFSIMKHISDIFFAILWTFM